MAVVIGTGAFFLALALVVNAVAFLVPYWAEYSTVDKGLWGDCTCRWHINDFQNYFQGGEDWFKAVQALYAIGIALVLLSILILMFVSCCREKQSGNGILVVGIFLILAFAAMACAIIVFGVMAPDSRTFSGGLGLTGLPRLGWGMWLGVVGTIITLVAGIMHIVAARRR